MSNDFVHLHLHTTYSPLDGIIKIPELVKRVKSLGMNAVAITDHGNLHGIIDFYKACKKENIRPIIGTEVYITENKDGIDNKDKVRDNHHCVLLAMDKSGLSEIIRLSNNGVLHNFYYKPRISIHNLSRSKHLDRIIATSACLGGIVSKKGVFDEEKETFQDVDGTALKRLRLFKRLFGRNFYAEIQDNPEFWEQAVYNNWLITNAKRERIPLVITSDAHFLTKEDKSIHDMVMAQQMKKTLEEYSGDEDGMSYGEGHYIRSPDEMLEAARKFNAEEAFHNTVRIAEQCNVEITLGEYQTPHFDITKEEDFKEFLTWKEEKSLED